MYWTKKRTDSLNKFVSECGHIEKTEKNKKHEKQQKKLAWKKHEYRLTNNI